MKKINIVVDGMTGAGKSSLIKILAETYDLRVYEEIFRDRYNLLEKFYKNKKRWALSMQLTFLINRYRQYQEALQCDKVIMDRSIFSDDIFARMYLDEGYFTPEEYHVYKNILQEFLGQVKPPRLMIYLRAPLDEILRRIKVRGREDEVKVEKKYWEKLYQKYEAAYRYYKVSPLLTIDTGCLNYVDKEEDRRYVVNLVDHFLQGSAEETITSEKN